MSFELNKILPVCINNKIYIVLYKNDYYRIFINKQQNYDIKPIYIGKYMNEKVAVLDNSQLHPVMNNLYKYIYLF